MYGLMPIEELCGDELEWEATQEIVDFVPSESANDEIETTSVLSENLFDEH